MSYSAWSTAFATDPVEQTRLYVSTNEWRRIHNDQASALRIFARIMIGDIDVFCPLGEPIQMDHFGDKGNNKSVILPNWVLEILRINGTGEEVEIIWLAENAFPNATKVILRPHDSAFFNGDIKEELERDLTSYGVLMEGTTIPVTVQSLDGFSVQIDVIRTYPANIVLLEGDEITFEFETALDVPAPEPAEQVAPEPVEQVAPEPVEQVAPPAPTGFKLGGVNHPPLPDGRPWNPWRI